MGEMAEYYRDYNDYDDDTFEEELETENVWTTKEDKKIPISKMTDSHLLNSIKYLYKNSRSLDIINILISEAIRRKLVIPKAPENYVDYSQCDATECDIY